MGLFWDLIQQSQISDQRARAETLEERVDQLETDLAQTRRIVRTMLDRLERHLDEDVDGDGSVGGAP